METSVEIQMQVSEEKLMPGDTTEGSGTMRAMRKSLMMRGMVLLHYGIMVALFIGCWWLFYRHAAAESAYAAVDISVCAFYAV